MFKGKQHFNIEFYLSIRIKKFNEKKNDLYIILNWLILVKGEAADHQIE